MLRFEKGSEGYSYLYLIQIPFYSWRTSEVQRSRKFYTTEAPVWRNGLLWVSVRSTFIFYTVTRSI